MISLIPTGLLTACRGYNSYLSVTRSHPRESHCCTGLHFQFHLLFRSSRKSEIRNLGDESQFLRIPRWPPTSRHRISPATPVGSASLAVGLPDHPKVSDSAAVREKCNAHPSYLIFIPHIHTPSAPICLLQHPSITNNSSIYNSGIMPCTPSPSIIHTGWFIRSGHT